jgi:aspartyl-tRNA(Asn)/glutamyl-tRNA(Gln) amidotransferase subunit C
VQTLKDSKQTDAITRADVQHVASLARLALSAEEEERFQHQLSAVFDHFQKLSALDTKQIPPTAQVIPLKNVMRADAVEPSLPEEDVLANAPDREEDQFRVRAILDF